MVLGTLTATVACTHSPISGGRCCPAALGGQDVCGAYPVGSLYFAF